MYFSTVSEICTASTSWRALRTAFEGTWPLVAGRGAGIFATHEAEDFAFIVVVGVADEDVQKETVHLRLGQRIGALLLDGILRGQHEKEIR